MADRHWSSEPASISSPLASHSSKKLSILLFQKIVLLGLDAVDGEPLLVNDEVPGAAEGQGQSQWM